MSGLRPAETVAGLAGIVMAAGQGRRMGRPKAALRVRGVPMVRLAAEAALRVCGAGVWVVTGAHRTAITVALADCPVALVHNRRWARGLGSSLEAGLAAVAGRCRAALVLPCDLPGVTAADLARLAAAWAANPDHPAAAGFAGTVGAPAILPCRYFAELPTDGDAGAGSWLRTRDTLTVVDIPAAARDVDSPADLAAARR